MTKVGAFGGIKVYKKLTYPSPLSASATVAFSRFEISDDPPPPPPPLTPPPPPA